MKWSSVLRPSPAMVVACIALGISLAGNAGAIDFRAHVKSTISLAYGDLSVSPGDVATGDAKCPPGDYALSGGFGLASGNFVYIVTAATLKEGDGFRVTAEVPNKLAAPGVQTAVIKIKVVCAQEGKPVVP